MQTVKFFTGLIHSPSLFIIDEPFNGMGDDDVFRINKLLRDLAGIDVSVIAASSHKGYLENITDVQAVISKGKIE
jgi:ABC-type multidrug transport system ATPase subunit